MHMITNLVANAIEYNRPGGEVRVSVAQSGEWVVLEVKDNGIGISEADLPNIFERFYRADYSRSADGHTGLGLAICKSIVDSHGGSIAAKSRLGSGTTFTVGLPGAGNLALSVGSLV
jgi:signal transduction histidine kinase